MTRVPISLATLDATFLKIIDERTHQREAPFGEADGVMFLCPECYMKNEGPVGTHAVICWRPHVPLTHSPGPGRWEFGGTGLDDLTLRAGSSSVLLPCGGHFFIRDGQVVW